MDACVHANIAKKINIEPLMRNSNRVTAALLRALT